jgi:hypothetical protein
MTEKKRNPQRRGDAKEAQRAKLELSAASSWRAMGGSANACVVITICFNYIFFA